MFKAIIFATFVALAAGQQDVQYTQPYNNVPLVFPQGQQFFGHYNEHYQRPHPYDCLNLDKIFKQYSYILLVDNQNQPLGYVYSDNAEAPFQNQQNFLPVIDYHGNQLGYFSTYLYKLGQEFQPQDLNENVISQLGQFGFIYKRPNQGRPGFMVVKNPYVFYNNDNGVLRPSLFQNGRCKFPSPNNFFGPNYNGQYPYPAEYYYGPGYNGQYFPRYHGQYYPFNQFPYNHNQYLPYY